MIIIVSLLTQFDMIAQQVTVTDSLRMYPVDTLVVHGKRLSNHFREAEQEISGEEIRQSPVSLVSDVLSHGTGVFVKDYGGTSGIKTISQRGLGTEHSVILLNGMRISSLQNGLLDLGTFPLEDVQQIEIFQGGYSSIVGADAVGGVVNLGTIPNKDAKTTGEIRSSFGSFGDQAVGIRSTVTTHGFVLQSSLGRKLFRGNFPFQFTNGNTSLDLERKNADLRASNASVQLQTEISKSDQIQFALYNYTSERGVPGIIVGPANSSRARQEDEETIVQFLYQRRLATSTLLDVNTQYHYQYERYNDPDLNIGAVSVENYFKNREIRIEPSFNGVPSANYSFSLGGELVRTSAEGNSISQNVVRNQYSGYALVKYNILLDSSFVQSVTLTPSVRYDNISQFPSAVSGAFEGLLTLKTIDYSMFQNILPVFRFSISNNYRAPTFNELYWSGGGGLGNPLLVPEHALNVDAGVHISFTALGDHSLKATYYSITMSDRILWVAAGFQTAVPKNIRSVSSNGMELSYNWEGFDKLLGIGFNYTYGNTVKTESEFPGDPTVNNQLPYIPPEMLNARFSLSRAFERSVLSRIGLSLLHQFVGYRYIEEDNKVFLPGYHVTSLALSSRLKFWKQVLTNKIEFNNVFNTEYQVMPGYPMPMRSFRFSLSLELR